MPHAASAAPPPSQAAQMRKKGRKEGARGQLSVARSLFVPPPPTPTPRRFSFPCSIDQTKLDEGNSIAGDQESKTRQKRTCRMSIDFLFCFWSGRLSSSIPVFVVRREKVCPGAAAAAAHSSHDLPSSLPSIRRRRRHQRIGRRCPSARPTDRSLGLPLHDGEGGREGRLGGAES